MGRTNVNITVGSSTQRHSYKNLLELTEEMSSVNETIATIDETIAALNQRISLLQKFVGKKLAIVGDSISTYQGWLPSDIPGYTGTTYANYYPSGNVDDVQKTWWYKVCSMLGINPSEDVNNCSWSGSRVTGTGTHIDSSSTTDAFMGCSTRRINDLSIRGYDPDIIICFISCNDWGNEVAVGTWEISDSIPNEGNIDNLREGYALMLHKINEEYPFARVFCCTILDDRKREEQSGWPSENGNGVTTSEWNKSIMEIAEAFGCDVINLHDCGINYSNIAQYFSVDLGLHPNAAGHELMAKKIASELFAKY